MKIHIFLLSVLLALGSFAPAQTVFDEAEPLGIAMENYPYPYPVQYFDLEIEEQDVRMAYMDVKPSGTPNGETVVLFHGKNFFGAYWEDTINTLRDNGYRVVVPDQIGFGKSSKPDIHYSFHLLAQNTKRLLNEIGVQKATIVGHSMGGMLATRFALMYPVTTTHLVLENPIGLEDYRIKVPFKTIESAYEGLLQRSEDGIRNYFKTYFVEWDESYEQFVQVHYRWTLSGEYPRMAWSMAATYEMVYTQPVVHEFPHVKVPTLLVIGQEDRTTLGRGDVSPEVLKTLGQYPELGKKTAEAIPNSKLVELDNVGHIPHLSAQEDFHQALLDYIE
ncbi:MAG: alpha/beta fold hydrolase [Candidatus Marinimicrobia bacterium]|nr:alpha/beta fold hydrolase [Candidatus Neomarinimicrobiota bacterium]